jgi:uncharacterized Zn-binding protein involved in type VI secretion
LIRYYIKEGDKTTSGAVVCEGDLTNTLYGVPLSFLGARIYCPACKSSGVLVGSGPRLKDTSDKPAALSDDLGVCKCKPTPRLIASQYDAYEECTTSDLAIGCAPDGVPLPRVAIVHDQQFTLLDENTRRPLSRISYRINSASGASFSGTTDENGKTQRVKTSNSDRLTVKIHHDR